MYGTKTVNEINPLYIIDATEILTAPIAGFNSLLGKSLYDKFLYWVHQKVADKIIADNPTFTVSIVDIKL
jgi:hypothetical protein